MDFGEDDEWFLNTGIMYRDAQTPSTWVEPMPEPAPGLTTDDILRWSSWTKPFPLPDHIVPLGPGALDNVSDEALMNAPPHMIVHIQRTAAQGGLQVVSPRQTPVTVLMSRVKDERRELGDHVVGSTASPSPYWPTIDDDDLEHFLPDEPLPLFSDEKPTREKTRTEPLTRAAHLLRDPILSCLVKGRAVIDVQQREDVMGDADGLTELLADAWGIESSQLMDLDAFSLGIDGPLLRHAIKADEVYPMVHAPIHQRRSVSVGSNEITRDILPIDSAMDWRRMRVFCEAVYLMTTSIEGIPLTKARAYPPPGDPTAPLTRPNILAFRPAPCIAWSFESRGFSICPAKIKKHDKVKGIPPEVLAALTKYTEVVRPVSHAMAMGHRAAAKKTTISTVDMPPGETITEGYRHLARSVMVGSARGRCAARTVRNLIHEALEAAPLRLRLRIARYIHIAKAEVKIHLGYTEVPDMMIDRIATKFLQVGETIRLKVLSEAARRGASAEQWWGDIVSQAPERYRALTEGSMGWARVAMWLTFRAPTDKWDKLERTVHYKAVRDAEVASIGGIALPAEKGTIDRTAAAARAVVKGITGSYFGYYVAVSDVGMAIADLLDMIGHNRSADIAREAAYLWVLRARCLRGTNVNIIAKDEPTPSQNHLRVTATPADLLVVPAPYRAFEAYRTHAVESLVLHKNVKRALVEFDEPKISRFFAQLSSPLAPGPESLLTRYLTNPRELASDMEQAWKLLRDDVARVVVTYTEESSPKKRGKAVPLEMTNLDLDYVPPPKVQKIEGAGKSYYDLMCEMDVDEVDWMEDSLANMTEAISGMLMEIRYDDISHLRRVFLETVDKMVKQSGKVGETVT